MESMKKEGKKKKERVVVMDQLITGELNLKSYPKGSVSFEPLETPIERLFFSRDEWVSVLEGLQLLEEKRQFQLKEAEAELELKEMEKGGRPRAERRRVRQLKHKIEEIQDLIKDLEVCSGVKLK